MMWVVGDMVAFDCLVILLLQNNSIIGSVLVICLFLDLESAVVGSFDYS